MLAYVNIFWKFFDRLPLTMPAPHQPGPELKQLVGSISAEAAGASTYY